MALFLTSDLFYHFIIVCARAHICTRTRIFLGRYVRAFVNAAT